MAEGEQALGGAEDARLRGRGQVGERIGEGLYVGERHLGERAIDVRQEALHGSTLGALGLRRTALEPQRDELGVGVPLACGEGGVHLRLL